MAGQLLAVGDSDDDFHSLSAQGDGDGDGPGDFRDDGQANADSDGDSVLDGAAPDDMEPPVHPISSLQGAFEESIVESFEYEDDLKPFDLDIDAEMRRRKLLQAERYEDGVTRWKTMPNAQHHPFLKLMAQIVFGMHLLQQEQAKSDEEVVNILQNHVNEVDSFLECTSDDFDLAITDVEERIRYLRLPMQHMDIFETMLDDKKFRADLLHGNDKIEEIVDRSTKAMGESLVDIQCGLKSTLELRKYLDRTESIWPGRESDIADVFVAMRGNEQGWTKYLHDLQVKGTNLSNELLNLADVIGEISRLAGIASRRNAPQNNNTSVNLRSKFAKGSESISHRKTESWLDKPLPREPDAARNSIALNVPKLHPVPRSARYEKPRTQAPVPGARSTSEGTTHSSRPRTSSSTKGRVESTQYDNAPAASSRHSGPLKSNPTDPNVSISTNKKSGRSVSQSARITLHAQSVESFPNTATKRSQSQSNIASTNQISPLRPSKPADHVPIKIRNPVKLVPGAVTDSPPLKYEFSSGFSRRVSMRLKHISPPLKTVPVSEPETLQPVDSARSSGRGRSTSTPTEATVDSTESPKDVKNTARLGLFPRDTGPLTPSQASMHNPEQSPAAEFRPSQSSIGALPAMPPPPQTPRSMGFRRFFHGKGKAFTAVAS